MLIDVNVLVAAHREDHPNHAIASRWLEDKIQRGDDSVEMFISVGIAASFLRLVTNVKLFPEPSTSAEAVDFIDWLLESQKVKFLSATNEWDVLRTIVLERALVVNAVPDAHLAALALSLSEPFVTFDKGFKKLLPRSLLVLLASKIKA